MLVRGRPRQLIVMKLNMRCSIRFHFEVPGGWCVTVISKPVSAESWARCHFHALTRYPFDPPQSAVINSRFALGNRCLPRVSHHLAIAATANSEVSAVSPTDTQPSLLATS